VFACELSKNQQVHKISVKNKSTYNINNNIDADKFNE